LQSGKTGSFCLTVSSYVSLMFLLCGIFLAADYIFLI
jgi:hypothetical protein